MTTEEIFLNFSVNLKKRFEECIALLDNKKELNDDDIDIIQKLLHGLKGNSVAYNFDLVFINDKGKELLEYTKTNNPLDKNYLRKELNDLFKKFNQKIK
ncbi:MAG: hypothetical protein C0601_09655 [Candidatus Muiribacterium halophilum]|uniref:HPt domain-containing protein n=1 Tax=Muiribacterium halophilum TaxID=2053465 RepID=A0A2N5ZDI2_MUIH1|nr:MAG: hypothetical protein C0601_09655 [Candidatus Muirbacterium halophilum]